LKLNKSFLYLDYSSRYTALTALGIRQEVKKLWSKFFIHFIFAPFLTFFWNVYLHLWYHRFTKKCESLRQIHDNRL